ncbi:MAG: tyrosine-type recombinase/integrase [Haliscomenobacter sp.]|nr:tyrosine-type recombinase/integrase [Haliscomenobacter sp.]
MNIDRFLQYLHYEKRFSPHTAAAYRNDLEQFRQFLQTTYGVLEMQELSPFHVRSWVVELVREGLTPNSIRRKVSALKSYFRFLRRQGQVQHNPLQALHTPKTGKRLPSVVPEKEMLSLLAQTRQGSDFSSLRDSLALELLYGTGMRRAELIQLSPSSADLDQLQLRVLGKGNKERLIPISASLGQLIARYVRVRAQAFPDAGDGALLLTDKGQPMYPKFLYHLVRRYLTSIPAAEQRSPHVLRHSFATHLADHGADLNAIKTLLGHANLAATQIYTHHTMERLRAIYQQAHPKAKIDDGG